VATDAQPDAQPDAELDAQPDAELDAQPDAEPDVQPDAEPDVQPDAEPDTPDVDPGACLDELPLQGVPTGNVCTNVPTITMTGNCDVVAQTGCEAGQYCDITIAIVQGASQLRVVCVDGEGVTGGTCEFVAVGEVCTQRDTANDPPERVGVCYPGSTCPGLRSTDLQTRCDPWCKLDTGLGCDATEFCVPISPESSAFGIGRCAQSDELCP
jgi:hypothetical protein